VAALKISDRLRDVAVSDSGFLFDPYTGLTFSVNTTGKFILDRLRQGASPDEVVAALGSEFDTLETDDLVRDVREFMLLMKEQGILPRNDET
jgi:hypothetical protein